MDSNTNRSDASQQPAIRLSQNAYARRIGVNPGTVNRWIKQGRISLGDDRLIDPELADRERAATESPMPHHQARKAQWEAEWARKAAVSQAHAEPIPQLEKLGAALKLETYKLQKAKAEQANLELDRAAGLLVERAEIDRALADFGATLRNLLEALPHRLAPELSALRGDTAAAHRILEASVADVLQELAAHIQRKMDAL